MTTINFLYRSQKSSSFLTCRLQFRIWTSEDSFKDIFIDGKSNHFITKDDWKSYVINKNKKSKLLEIINLKNSIETEITELSNFILSDFNINHRDLHNKVWFQKKLDIFYKKNFSDAEQKSKPEFLVSFMERFIQVNVYKENTLKNIKTVIAKLKGFEGHVNREILISEVNYDFKEELVEYFDYKGYSPSTIERDFGTVKTFCNYARKKGAILDLGFEDFKYKVAEDDVIYPILTLDELKSISELKDLPDYLDNARDWLVISCFTGQRISDFLNFSSSLIRVEKGNKLIEFKQEKTGKLMSIPVLSNVQEILNKRNGEFPRKISDQKYNDYIKLVCEESKLTEKTLGYKVIFNTETKEKRRIKGYFPKCKLITSHCGRRSLATNFYGRIPTSDLMYFTGHTREANFLRYINKSNSDRAHEIATRFQAII